MRNTFLFVAFSLGLLFSAVAQDDNLTVTSLVDTHVDSILQQHLVGGGVILSNGKFNNQAGNVVYPQIGTFHRNGFTAFPFDSGLVITTGNVSLAAGPNNSGSASSAVSDYYTDPDLSAYNSNVVMASAVLETDFIASADWFTLNYIFASEEYCEYVNSTFNDVIVILLTGVDPVTTVTSTKNVAVIPGSVTASNPNGIPVGINTVNHGSHGPGSGPGDNPGDATHFVCNAANTQGVQYDGYTTALSAGATVFSCQTYHLKVAVANVGDNSLDSGVFLEEGGFHSPGVELVCLWEDEQGGDTLVQGSHEQVEMAFKLERPALTAYTSIVINAEGDAMWGADYTLIDPYGNMMNPIDNVFFFQPGDSVLEMQVVMLPTIGFVDSNQVKEARLIVFSQGCDGVPELTGNFQKADTVVVYFRPAAPEPDTTNSVTFRDLDSQWVLYPNPAGDFVTVDLKELSDDVREIALVDISGRVLQMVRPTENLIRIDLSDLPSGTYSILLSTQKGHSNRFFVKQ
jgi:hypothetical protein